MRKLTGRKVITTSMGVNELEDIDILCDVLNDTYAQHLVNKSDIDYLINYHKGVQPILNKQKPIREDINNTLVVNHAQMVTRMIGGYFLGNPIEYIPTGYSDNKEQLDKLNRYVQYEDKASVDRELVEIQSITGTSFRIIYRDGEHEDEVPFEDRSLNPSTTYVVYEDGITQQPLIGNTYVDNYDSEGELIGKKHFIYTLSGRYVFEVEDGGEFTPSNFVEFRPYNVGGLPIIEYPNNMWRIGDWEMCIGLMDAINDLHSGRLDDIEQTVQSLIAFINADIDPNDYDIMIEKGVISLRNDTNSKSDLKVVSNPLDQVGMNMFAKELEDLLYAMLGIPDRNNRAGGGGDTGQAVELRDGWADLEIVARNKELVFKKSEKRTLKVITHMFNAFENEDLSVVDIDIKFSRNKTNNLLVKTQAYQSLLSTKTLSPGDCLTIVDLVSDVNDYIARGEQFWGEEFATKSYDYSIEGNEGIVEGEEVIKEPKKEVEEVEIEE